MSMQDFPALLKIKQNAANIRLRFSRWGLLLFLGLFLSACTTLGPDFEKPDPIIENEWLEKESPQIKTESGDYGEWWIIFNDPVLNNFIEMASEQNLSLQVAGLRILESRALLGIAIGNQYPQAQQLNGGYSFLKSSKNSPPFSSFPDEINSGIDDRSNVYQIGFDAAWELDFWGKFRRGVEAADASLAASIASYDNLLVMLTGEVAAAYVVVRTLEQQLEYVESNVNIQQRSHAIAKTRFGEGATSELDVQQARSLLHNTQSLVPVIKASIRQAKHGLSVLLGMPPSDLEIFMKGPSAIPEPPAEVAIGIPADLLRRRPDIRLAEFQAAAQGALIGVAQADLYPHFAIGGSIGFSASNGSDLFDSASLTSLLSPFSFRWNILNYGRIKNNVRVQDARFEQLLTSYQNKVLQAAKEVEDGLVGFINFQQQARFLSDAVEAALRASQIALLQYEEGLIGYTPVLFAQQTLVSQQDRLASSRGDITRYLIAVYKALGGGWQTREGKNIIPEQMAEEMRQRTDWGNMLDAISLPTEMEQPPTGKDVKLLNKPEW
jgi:NodT family efflux transporter outer membrane factor (OMF) lipoprotein